MREWQMTDDQFRAQSYKNMQIQKRKRKSEKRARTEDVPLVKNERKVEFGYFLFQTNRGTRHDNKLNIQKPTAQR